MTRSIHNNYLKCCKMWCKISGLYFFIILELKIQCKWFKLAIKLSFVVTVEHTYSTKGKPYPAGIYRLKVNNTNTRTSCEICLKLFSHVPAFLQLTLNMQLTAGYVAISRLLVNPFHIDGFLCFNPFRPMFPFYIP